VGFQRTEASGPGGAVGRQRVRRGILELFDKAVQ
jgi:hypothetical protein